MEPHVADVGVRAGEDGDVVDREHSHVVEVHELLVFHLDCEREDAESVVAESKHGVPEHQAHDSRLHSHERIISRWITITTAMMMVAVVIVAVVIVAEEMKIWIEREGERVHPLDVTRERRERSDEALESVNDDEAVVEQIRLRDLHASDEHLRRRHFILVEPLRCDRNATAGAESLDLRAKRELPKIVGVEEAGDEVLTEEVLDGAGDTGEERRVGGSEESRRTGPAGGRRVGERRRRRGQLVEAKLREDLR